MFTGPEAAVTASVLDGKHTAGGGSLCVGKTRQQGEEGREGTEVGNCQAFCLGCNVEGEREELSVEILGKDQHIPHWLRTRQYAQSCKLQHSASTAR